jgi:3-methylcrotonyl-CoA carboxylase alpha subunit
MFNKILIANRGEIACRVISTARRMGIKTVAVYSTADANALHVAMADEAVCIGGAAPKDSYLRGEVILREALRLGAQAIHPGYGFLSENEAFAQACADAGIKFIGPPPSAIQAMGLKAESKRLMAIAGVPLTPGYHGASQEPALLLAEAEKIGFPVLIKASAGGGGKGMKPAFSSAEFLPALASAKREAKHSFGDDAVLIEKYLTAPRHVEVQVFADRLGGCVYLFDRDCSVQRRHQKVIEEAPAPNLPETMRKAMGGAAVAAARAVHYEGAGTVEFIVEGGQFYFMEMNTRLQVEHPVTEMIVGVDLVEWQLRVASGEALPLAQHELRISGHAMEARVYAEDPANQFLPDVGELRTVRFPQHTRFNRESAVRVDAAICEGADLGEAISPYYDPMIAKLIVHADNREQAIARLAAGLAETDVLGIKTNIAFLSALLAVPDFAQLEQLDTGLIARNHEQLFAAKAPASVTALAVAAYLQWQSNSATSTHPWAARDGFGSSGQIPQQFVFTDDTGVHPVSIAPQSTGYLIDSNGQHVCAQFKGTADALQVTVNEQQFNARACQLDHTWHVRINGERTALTWLDPLALPTDSAVEQGHLTAPMPGSVIAVHVSKGEAVVKGQALIVMEAMKMEHTLSAPYTGVVSEIYCAVGEQVKAGVTLIAIEE